MSSVILFAMAIGLADPALAQNPSSPDEDVVSVDAGISVTSQYLFRGVRQNSTGVAVWPYGDVSFRAFAGDGLLEQVVVGVGFWTSLNTGDTGSGGPLGKAWYESRVRGSLGLRFDGGVSVATTYTAYASPNDLFTTVRELAVRLGLDDRTRLGAVAFHPYALVAFELNSKPGVGQLDGGRTAGRYLELGLAPLYAGRFASLAVPVKAGLSLRDYYELAGKDHTFGFASVGVEVTVPLGGMPGIRRWNLHGGVEMLRLGETTRVFNGGDQSNVVVSVGVGITR